MCRIHALTREQGITGCATLRVSLLVFCALLLLLLEGNGVRASGTPQVALQSGGTAKVVLFHSPTCPHCHEVIDDILPPLRAEYKDRLELNLIDVTFPANYQVFFKFQERHPGMYHAIPEIAIGDAILVGTQAIQGQLRAEIDKCLAKGGCEWPVGGAGTSLQQNPLARPNAQPTVGADCGPALAEGTAQPADIGACQIPAEVESRTVERIAGSSALAMAGAGLLDGVNPYAFTTIILFISSLALVGHQGREILTVGAAFTVGVFLTYLVLGLGLSELVRQIGPVSIIGRVIYGITALICVVLAVLSIWDYTRIQQGKLTEIVLQLPSALKQHIHHIVRARMAAVVGAAFGAGVLVSVIELVCTGLAYPPTIVFAIDSAELRLQAIAHLILYNLMFVVPLGAVFLVTYLGTSSRQLTAVFQSNAAWVKLLTAVLFAIFGVWLAYIVLA